MSLNGSLALLNQTLTADSTWMLLKGGPFVTVTPNGPTDGGNYGPNTQGTQTGGGIQEAIDAVGALGGGTVFIAAGKYTLAATVVDGGFNGVNIQGAGASSVINFVPNAAFNAFNINKSRWIISGILVDGTNQTRVHGNIGIYFGTASTHCSATNCFVTQVDHGGIYSQGKETLISGNHVYSTSDDNIILNAASDCVVSGNVCDTTSNYNNISLVSCTDCTVSDNVCANAANDGVALENLGSGACLRCIVRGNQVIAPAGNGIEDTTTSRAAWTLRPAPSSRATTSTPRRS